MSRGWMRNYRVVEAKGKRKDTKFNLTNLKRLRFHFKQLKLEGVATRFYCNEAGAMFPIYRYLWRCPTADHASSPESVCIK